MANSIALITKYSAENLDEKFTLESCTGILEENINVLNFTSAKTVKVPSITMDGLGDYSRSTGFPDGDVSLTWEDLTLSKDRAKSFTIDNMDNEETAGVAYGKLQEQFMKTKVIPEVDAYRLSKIYSKAKTANVVTAAISANTIISEFNKAIKAFADAEVEGDAVLFISTAVDLLIKNTTELSKRITQEDYTSRAGLTFKVRMYEGIPIVVVPPTRFKTAYTFGTNGFTPAAGAKDLDFMLVNLNSALPVKKHEKVRVFTPDVNQDADAYKFQYRLYHDIFTTANKVDGIYAHVYSAT